MMKSIVAREVLSFIVGAVIFSGSHFIFFANEVWIYAAFSDQLSPDLAGTIYYSIMLWLLALTPMAVIFFTTLFWRRSLVAQNVIFIIDICFMVLCLQALQSSKNNLVPTVTTNSFSLLGDGLAALISVACFYGLARITRAWINNRARS